MEHSHQCLEGSPAANAGAGKGEPAAHHGSHQGSTPQAHDLKPKQTIALDHLVAGTSITKAAKAAGVDRTTVHRWLREDLAFQAAHNRAQHDLRREMDARMPHLANAALETVQEAVREGDVRAALAVLKGLGALPGSLPAFGSDDREELAEDQRAAHQAKQFRQSLKGMVIG